MARYVGKADFATLVELGRQTGKMNLLTDEGPVNFKIAQDDGRIISGSTDDGKLVAVDIEEPDNIAIT